MFKVIRSVRSLQLNYNFKQKIMPEEVGYLHHLRYLRFSARNVNLLPRSLSSLYHLMFIRFDRFSSCLSNDFFPRDMSNLSNLRVILFNDTLKFPGIGKLKFLQELKELRIKDENGYRVEELEHMNELRCLELVNLKDVRDAEEAYKAKLCDKRKLIYLSLRWSLAKRDNADHDLDERVLDNLQPHNYLKTLHIYDYMGDRSAIWMNKAHLINNLHEIQLHRCTEWEIIPPFGQLPFLKTLYLRDMTKAKRLENKFHGNDMHSCVFPSLKTLWLRDMEALVEWFDASIVDDLFPCLTQLFLFNCPNLKELPYLPPKLEELKIDQIGWKTLNCCSISTSIPLKIVQVGRCPNITSISLEGVMGKLEKLIIIDLPSLQPLEGEMGKLEKLITVDLQSLYTFPSSSANISSREYL